MTYLADTLAAEGAAIEAGADPCRHTCECHGGYVCRRAQHVDDVPHIGCQEDGSLVQWHAGACLTEEQADAARWVAAAQRKTATEALLGSIDLSALVEALRAGGHL